LIEEQLRKFELKAPEIVFEWNDVLTDAKGWMVINSLRGGAAGGGTRIRKGLDKQEVISLAKTMEIKFSVSGPAIGGAKSGINFDPADPRKQEVLQRWYKALMPILKAYYGTGGDLNVDEIHEVIPITENYGLWHPQEGVVNGHFGSKESDKIKRLGQLRLGVSKIVEDATFSPDTTKKYKVADLITGYGVAESVRHYYTLKNIPYDKKRVIVQGWGNVASAAAYYLAKAGFLIVGIIDRNGGIIEENGLSFEEVKSLFITKEKQYIKI
jgi:glutamate dehydrogenase/leucine dehydrogenase